MKFDHSVNDTLMRFFDHCARFVHGVDNNASAVAEVNNFRQGPEMRRVQEKIAQRLGVPHSIITYGDACKNTVQLSDWSMNEHIHYILLYKLNPSHPHYSVCLISRICICM